MPTKCIRCKVGLFGVEIRLEKKFCSECWDIAYPNGRKEEIHHGI